MQSLTDLIERIDAFNNIRFFKKATIEIENTDGKYWMRASIGAQYLSLGLYETRQEAAAILINLLDHYEDK